MANRPYPENRVGGMMCFLLKDSWKTEHCHSWLSWCGRQRSDFRCLGDKGLKWNKSFERERMGKDDTP